MNSSIGYYPEINDKKFYEKIYKKKEFYDYRQENEFVKNIYCLQNHQILLRNFINPLSIYSSILIYHSVGVGKTLSAIAIAENFKDKYNILVLTKNKLLQQNFKRELQSNCYSSKTGYSFMTYGLFTNRVLGLKQYDNKYRVFKNKLDNIDNTVLIVDEVHNLTGNDGYKAVKRMIDKSKNIKIILLTATPMYDNIREIFEIANLLNPKSKLPIIGELTKEKYIKYYESKDDILKNTIGYLTKLGRDKLTEAFKGKVSYLIQDTKDFPRKIFKGVKVFDFSDILVYPCKMSKFQEDIYLSNTPKEDPDIKQNYSENFLFKNSSDILTMVYPDNSYGKEGFIKYISNSKDHSFLLKENISKYSTKLASILKNISETDGTCFIYSNYVNYGGVELIKQVLKVNGYSEFNKGGDKKFTFASIEEKTPEKIRRKIISTFNSKDNINGKNIKIIIGSFILSEGVSFKNIRQLHILEPYWNFSRIEQIIGRAIRYKSHQDLKPKDRNVNVFLYTAVSNKIKTIDTLKYQMSINKDKIIKNVEYLLRKIAFDCNLNKNRNTIKNNKDKSRDCLYKNCDFKCVYTNPESKYVSTDKTTYNISYHAREEYTFISNKIEEMFSKNSIYSTKDILEYIKNEIPSIHKNNIYYVLTDYIENLKQIKDKYNRNCDIINEGKYYIANPDTNIEKEPYINKLYKKVIQQKAIVPEEKQISKKSIKKIDSVIINKPGIYATYIDKTGNNDNVFRLIDTRNVYSGKVSEDNRKIFSGKVCSYYSKEDLISMIKFFNYDISPKGISKQNMCKLLEYFLKQKNLIV